MRSIVKVEGFSYESTTDHCLYNQKKFPKAIDRLLILMYIRHIENVYCGVDVKWLREQRFVISLNGQVYP